MSLYDSPIWLKLGGKRSGDVAMKNIRNILFYADGAPSEKAALKRAVELAGELKASVTLMDVVAEVSTTDNNPAVKSAIQSLQQVLMDEREDALKKLWDESNLNYEVDIQVVAGKNYVELIKQVVNKGIDLLIKGSNKPSLISKAFFGEVDLRLMRKCPCPVWILKPSRRKKLVRILAAVDPLDTNHDDLNKQIVEYASYVSALEDSELVVMGCWTMPFDISLEARLGRDKLDLITDGIKKQCELNLQKLTAGIPAGLVKTQLLKGEPEDIIPNYVKYEGVDLVVMGTLGRTGIPGLIIGNTAEKILHLIKCSVLALKPQGFVHPVV